MFAQQANQSPTFSVTPSNVVMYSPVTTINIAISPVTSLNSIEFLLTYNDQGTPFLSVSTADVVLGNLFTGQNAQLYTNIYTLNSTGLSYISGIIELPGNAGVSSTTTKNLVTITLHLVPTAIAGLQTGLNLTQAQAYFTNNQYVDQRTGIIIQNSALTVGYLTTTMTANSLTTIVGNAVTLTSILQDSQGNPLSGETVNYYVGSQNVGTAITDASGVSSLSYTPSAAGTYTINAGYVGNQTGGTFASSNATATLTVTPQNTTPTTKTTTLSLSVPQTAATGTAVSVQATLNQGNSPLPNESIVFSATPTNGSAVAMGSATTNSNGVATVSYTFSAAGSYNVQANFLGDANNQPSSTSASLSVSSTAQISTTLTLTLQPSATIVGQQVMLLTTLKDSSQNPIIGQTVVYTATVNGQKQTIGSATTDSNGNSSIPFTPTQAAIYQIDASFGGSSTYSSSSGTQYLTANAQSGKTLTTLTVTLSSNSVNTQTFVTISATLDTQSGAPLAQENIVYQFSTDGVSWTNITTTATGSDGIAQTSYKPAQTGSLLIRASFNGDTSYYSSVSNAETILVTNGTTNSTIPWLLVSLISVIAVVVVVAVTVTMMKLRKPTKPKKKPKS
jgi:hypothetical protein